MVRPLTALSVALGTTAVLVYRRENREAATAAIGRVRTPSGIALYGNGPVAPDHRVSAVLGVLASGVGACSVLQVRRPNMS